MARAVRQFICQVCGASQPRWQGKCDACNSWNSLVEEGAVAPVSGQASGPASRRKGRTFQLEGLRGDSAEPPRLPTGMAELDRVTGGGFVHGSVVLIGGDPGIGKSTLLIQACAQLARGGHRVVYISGEEAVGQVRLRAERLQLSDAAVELASETNVEDIITTLSQGAAPRLVVIDSIQTMWTGAVDSAPGTVTQVRGSAQNLIRFAKTSGAALILVGHVTKDGQIAGPRVVEHMVDAVASFEGESGHHFRLLRAVKNRFGPTDEIGVFEMTGLGLTEVANPSALFLAGRDVSTPGTAVLAAMEGTRPLLVEVQALVAPSALGTPRRAVVGFDSSRLSMIIAVLEAHGGVRLAQHDVYLNVAGGMKIGEPAADLAAAAALVSSLSGNPLPPDTVYFGEIGLSGAIRPVIQAATRAREAAKLGFKRVVSPPLAQEIAPEKSSGKTGGAPADSGPLRTDAVSHISDLVAQIAAGSGNGQAQRRPVTERDNDAPRPSRQNAPRKRQNADWD